jgi:hypothetical protein
MALGGLVTLMGAAGIFAVVSDRATTGTNSVSSGAQASTADLKIAPVGADQITCQTFEDGLTTGLFSMADVQPGDPSRTGRACLKNAGPTTLRVTTSAIDLVDSETGCTGDEQASGDTTCGTGVGELSPILQVKIGTSADIPDCSFSGNLGTRTLASLTTTTVHTADINPGAQMCVTFTVQYPATTSASDVQKAQSDSVTWRFAFDGTTLA